MSNRDRQCPKRCRTVRQIGNNQSASTINYYVYQHDMDLIYGPDLVSIRSTIASHSGWMTP